MKSDKHRGFEDDENDFRRSVHDVAANIISIRSLAETLDEHVPLLVAMSRSRFPTKQEHIPPEILDSLPALPAEIIKLCAIAREALQTLGGKPIAKKNGNSTLIIDSPLPPDSRSADGDRSTDHEGARVLLVEDEETIRYVLSQTLQAQGCLVTSSRNGEDALRLFDETDFDLVLMDLRLPGMSGLETTQRLREIESTHKRRTLVIGLTASPLLDDQVRAKAAGMDDVLVNPVDASALRAVLRSLAF